MIEPAYRTESTVTEDGMLNLRDLPFPPGEALEVILIPRTREATLEGIEASLWGSVLRYDPAAAVARNRSTSPAVNTDSSSCRSAASSHSSSSAVESANSNRPVPIRDRSRNEGTQPQRHAQGE